MNGKQNVDRRVCIAQRRQRERQEGGREREPPTRLGARYIWNTNEAMAKPHRRTDQIPERVSLLTCYHLSKKKKKGGRTKRQEKSK